MFNCIGYVHVCSAHAQYVHDVRCNDCMSVHGAMHVRCNKCGDSWAQIGRAGAKWLNNHPQTPELISKLVGYGWSP